MTDNWTNSRNLTGDAQSPVLSYKFYVVRVPDDLNLIAAFNGALVALGKSANWKQVLGNETVEQAALLMRDLLDSREEGTMPLGTMAYQDADAVDIEGGVIRNISAFSGLFNGDPVLEQEGSSFRFIMTSYHTQGSSLDLQQARGTKAAPLFMQNNDFNEVRYRGYGEDLGFYYNYAIIRGQATEAHTATAHGSKILFYTTPNGTTATNNAMTIDQDKSLVVEGNFRSKGPMFAIRNKTLISVPNIVGSRAGNVALLNLLTALVNQGIVTDGTTV